MTRALWWVIPAVGVGAALLGTTLSPGLAVALAVALGAAVALLVRIRERSHIRRLTRRLSTWLEDEADRKPVRLAGGSEWRELSVAVNALARAMTHLELAQANAEPRRDEIVDALLTPTLLFDEQDRLVTANRAAREMLGADPEEARTVIQVMGASAAADAASEARATGRRVTVEAQVAGREARMGMAPVGEDLLVFVTDLTRERRVEDLRRNFVTNASHELKTPATSIQTLTDALRIAIERDPNRARDLVSRLEEESQRLGHLVRDLLDLRRLESDASAERSMVDLAAIARTVVAELALRAAERDIELAVDAPDSALIAAIPDDVELIVRNLVVNAMQYNREGGSGDVRIQRRGPGYELTVSDTGLGIPQQDIQRIFERFYRVDVARSREIGGTGLGLSIVRHAVERHGGSVRVDSLLGEGSTFTVVLPIEPEDTERL